MFIILESWSCEEAQKLLDSFHFSWSPELGGGRDPQSLLTVSSYKWETGTKRVSVLPHLTPPAGVLINWGLGFCFSFHYQEALF
jgi:hypothetical protein